MTSSPVQGLAKEEYEYIRAVIEDRTHEFDIGGKGEYSLFTDFEGDGRFFPSVTILHLVENDEEIDSDDEIEKINSLLANYPWFNYDRTSDFQDHEASGSSRLYFHNPSIDEETLESVRETL